MLVSCLHVTSYFWPHFAVLGCSRAHADWRRSTRRSAKCTWYQLRGGEPHSGTCWLSRRFVGVALLLKVFKKTPSFYSLSNCYLGIDRVCSGRGGLRAAVTPCSSWSHTDLLHLPGWRRNCWFVTRCLLDTFPFWNTLVALWFLAETSVFHFESCSLRSKAQVLQVYN